MLTAEKTGVAITFDNSRPNPKDGALKLERLRPRSRRGLMNSIKARAKLLRGISLSLGWPREGGVRQGDHS